jgi:hypothetical protein
MQEGFLKAFIKIDAYQNEVAWCLAKKIIIILVLILQEKIKFTSDDFNDNLYKIGVEKSYADVLDLTHQKCSR